MLLILGEELILSRLEGNTTPVFQGGHLRRITISATAGNVVTNLSPSGYSSSFRAKRWIILRGFITLVTDASVANRSLQIYITDGTNIIEQIGTGSTLVASKTGVHQFGEVDTASSWTRGPAGADVNNYATLRNLILEGADQFRIQVASGVAGDSYSGEFQLLETVP